jgi:hypothetical protein
MSQSLDLGRNKARKESGKEMPDPDTKRRDAKESSMSSLKAVC